MMTIAREFFSKQRLLVISPHADDEVIGAGGLIAKIKDAGGEVLVMVFSIGDVKHFTTKGEIRTLIFKRKKELNLAMKYLGVDDYEIVFEDSKRHLRLDTLSRRDLIDIIERKRRLSTEKTKPTMIVLPAPSFNQDHEAIYKAGIAALRPHLSTLKSFQNFVLIADAPQLAWGTLPIRANFYVDISGDFLDKKIKAYSLYKSQQRPSPSEASVETLRLLANIRGREISIQSAEAFECIRFVI